MEPFEIIALHWICECGQPEDIYENAKHVVDELEKAGYVILRKENATYARNNT
jgi:hypothetical protein